MDWMLLPLRRYAEFQGRSRPKEYWLFALFMLVATILLMIVEAALGLGSTETSRMASDGGFGFQSRHDASWLVGIFMLATIVPSIAVGVRRLHDTDRSGWWLLIGFIPLIGTIILLVFLVSGGTRGPNRFGNDPVVTTVA